MSKALEVSKYLRTLASLNGETRMQGGHLTTTDLQALQTVAHANMTKEVGQTARSGFTTIRHVSGTNWWAEMSTFGKIMFVVVSIGGIGLLLKLVLDATKQTYQVASVEPAKPNEMNANVNVRPLGEVKALPASSAKSWNEFIHGAMADLKAVLEEARTKK
jgi:hypothetical protein